MDDFNLTACDGIEYQKIIGPTATKKKQINRRLLKCGEVFRISQTEENLKLQV